MSQQGSRGRLASVAIVFTLALGGLGCGDDRDSETKATGATAGTGGSVAGGSGGQATTGGAGGTSPSGGGAGGTSPIGGGAGGTSPAAGVQTLLAEYCGRDEECAIAGGDAWEFASIDACAAELAYSQPSEACDQAFAANLSCIIDAGSCQIDPSNGNPYQYFGVPDDSSLCGATISAEDAACGL